jgi:hypothetical protein
MAIGTQLQTRIEKVSLLTEYFRIPPQVYISVSRFMILDIMTFASDEVKFLTT